MARVEGVASLLFFFFFNRTENSIRVYVRTKRRSCVTASLFRHKRVRASCEQKEMTRSNLSARCINDSRSPRGLYSLSMSENRSYRTCQRHVSRSARVASTAHVNFSNFATQYNAIMLRNSWKYIRGWKTIVLFTRCNIVPLEISWKYIADVSSIWFRMREGEDVSSGQKCAPIATLHLFPFPTASVAVFARKMTGSARKSCGTRQQPRFNANRKQLVAVMRLATAAPPASRLHKRRGSTLRFRNGTSLS